MGPLITRGTSDITTSHALTGGEYKTQEHIHRNISDLRLLAIPTSWSRVADSNPDSLFTPLYHVCSPRRKSHADLTSSTPSSLLTKAVSLDNLTKDMGCAR